MSWMVPFFTIYSNILKLNQLLVFHKLHKGQGNNFDEKRQFFRTTFIRFKGPVPNGAEKTLHPLPNLYIGDVNEVQVYGA